MKSVNPASLQNLNDIVLPASVGWWPLAAGWYVLLSILLIVSAWFGYRLLHRWQQNRYRRAALRELQLLRDQVLQSNEPDVNLRQIPVVLKRTALSAYPRDTVASLSGTDWLHFLNSTTKQPVFNEATANTLSQIAYSDTELKALDSQAISDLLDASHAWLKSHQARAWPQDIREA